MHKKLIIIFLLVFSTCQACDICGCQLSGLYFGLLANTNAHYIGLRYTKASFNATIDYNSELLPNEFSDDQFHRLEIMGRYMISNKSQIHAIIPYNYNDMNGSIQSLTFQGIGDPTILLYFTPFSKKEEKMNMVAAPDNSKASHTWLIGGGIKLPLGEFNRFDEGEVVNRNFQIGTGSVDFLISSNYSISLKKWGLNIEGSYKINTENKNGYLFGNQFNASSYLFYTQPLPNALLSPYAGIFYETGKTHTDQGILQVNTGGNATHATLGLQLNWNSITVNTFYQTPVDQNYNTDAISTINSGDRFTVGVLYNFKKKKKKKYGFQ